MPSRIIDRIERQLGFVGLAQSLAGRLPASDLRSLMLEVYEQRAAAVTEAGIRERAGRDALMRPSTVDARELARFDAAAFEAASDFAALDLSPVCPFGAAAKLGGTSQNNTLTAIRNAETLGDSTIALALEAVRRRPHQALVRLCASHRVIRLQPLEAAEHTPHFRLFALVTAGRDTGSSRFETSSLLEHVRVYLRMFRMLNGLGFALRNPLVEFADMRAVEARLTAHGVTREEVRKSVRAHKPGASERFLRDRGVGERPEEPHAELDGKVIPALREEFPEAEFCVNSRRIEGLGYYNPFTLRISPEAPDGRRYAIVDGGFTDWTARLLADRKERLLISGIGTELVCKVYREERNS